MDMPQEKKTTGHMLLKEVRELREAIDDLQLAVDDLNPTFGKKATNWFLGGMIRGLGVLLGTTLIAAIVIFGLRELFSSEATRRWTGERLQEFLTDSIESIDPLGSSSPAESEISAE